MEIESPKKTKGYMSTIKLCGEEILLDDEDVKLVESMSWHKRHANKSNNLIYFCHSKTRLHRLLISAPPDFEVDHINGNTLDNRKSNLRLATHSQNMANRRRSTKSKNRYKGIRLTPNGKYQSRIRVGGSRICLGTFNCETAAWLAYVRAARKYHGEFAKFE